MTPEEIEALTDTDLLHTLKAHDISCGPIVDTTRSLYKNKLKKFYKERNKSASIKHPANYVKRTETTNKPVSTRVIQKENSPPPIIENISPIRYASKQVIETQTDDVYVENVRSPISELRSSFGTKKAHSTPKIYPDLDEYNQHCPAYKPVSRPSARQFMQQEPPVYNYYQPTQRPKMEFKLLNPDLIQNRPTPFLRTSPAVDSSSRLHHFQENNPKYNYNDQYQYNYRYEHRDQLQQQRPLLNLAGSLSNQRSLYDEPAPPQPYKKLQVEPTSHQWPNAKGWFLISFVILFVFWFSYTNTLPIGNSENPIKTY